ncbi:hypothetical protein [Anaerofustis butyriciformans]|uniref:hypothetical protein n=1 Tax=Anaerofustis butyriciformans TaxID=3108533 RepID=UPI002E32187E|nr:hypothetical protein [Anaerofustis sp. HA2171]
MKKLIMILMCIMISVSLISCKNEEEVSQSTSQNNLQNSEENIIDENKEKEKEKDNEIIDLTKLSSTMVYSEVYNIMVNPDDYVGKTLIMKGQFTVYHDEKKDKNYYSCIIQDATACCAQGIEFVLAGDYEYPQDYPKEGEEITVMGEFIRYSEGKHVYCTLKDAKLL